MTFYFHWPCYISHQAMSMITTNRSIIEACIVHISLLAIIIHVVAESLSTILTLQSRLIYLAISLEDAIDASPESDAAMLVNFILKTLVY